MKELTNSSIVSVVIPVYNVEGLLERCVGSVIRQTYSALQIILVDDGSTDSSGSICDDLAKCDDRIVVVHTANGGLSSARNEGMKWVAGEWVVFVDSDDMIGERHVEFLMEAVRRYGRGTSIAVTGSTSISSSGSQVWIGKTASPSFVCLSASEAIQTSLKEGNKFASHAWGKLYPKKMFPLLAYPVGKYFEDQFVTYKLFLAADCIVYEDANDYGYTNDRIESISNSSYLHRLDYLAAIRIMRDDLKEGPAEVYEAVCLRYYSVLASSIAIATMSSDPRLFDVVYSELVKVRSKALRFNGLSIKTRVVYLLSYFGDRFSRRVLTGFALRVGKDQGGKS